MHGFVAILVNLYVKNHPLRAFPLRYEVLVIFRFIGFHLSLTITTLCNVYVFFDREGDLRVIRPLIYVREKELRQFAESRRLPIIPENCPACFEQPKVSSSITRVEWWSPLNGRGSL